MLIIDANVVPSTFNPADVLHADFAPVRNFLLVRHGLLVIGGTKYLSELAKMPRYLAVISELEKMGQVRRLVTADVDGREQQVSALRAHPHFDDQHVVAMVGVSRARVVVSRDFRSVPFLKDRSLYPAGCKCPKIYSDRRAERLLLFLPRAR